MELQIRIVYAIYMYIYINVCTTNQLPSSIHTTYHVKSQTTRIVLIIRRERERVLTTRHEEGMKEVEKEEDKGDDENGDADNDNNNKHQ